MKEYNAEVVLSLLLLKERNAITEEFYKSMDTFQCFIHFCVEKPEVIANKILSDKDNAESYLNGLVSIYPLSVNILRAVTDQCEKIDLDISKWLDVSKTIEDMLTHILSLFNKGLDPDNEPNAYTLERIEAERTDHEEKINVLKAKKAEALKKQEENKALIKQCKDLEKEVEQLKRDSSESELKKEISKLEEKKREINKANQNSIAQLRKLENDVNDYEEHADASIQELLKNLAVCLKAIPEGDVKK